MTTLLSPKQPPMSRQETNNTVYYDANGPDYEQAALGPEETSPVSQTFDSEGRPVANDSGVDFTRKDISTSLQSPIPQSGFQNHGSIMRGDEQPYPMPQPALNNEHNLQRGAETTAGEDDTRSLKSMQVLYDESKGGFHTVGNSASDNGGYKRSASQQSNRSNRFGSRGPNKLVKSQSMRSRNDAERSASRASRRSAYEVVTSAPGATIGDAGGAFALGAAMTSPEGGVQDDLGQGFRERTLAAEGSLSKQQSMRIRKNEQSFGKRISRVIKNEGKAEQQALETSIKELAEIQKMQQAAVKEGARNHTAHTKALSALHNRELAVIKAQSDLEKVEADIEARLAKVRAELVKGKAKVQAQFDRAQAEVERARADVKSYEDSREASKQHALDTTEWVKDKRKEVEVLKGWLGVDEREREAKYNELKGKVKA